MEWKVKTAEQMIADIYWLCVNIPKMEYDPKIEIPQETYANIVKDCPEIKVGLYAPGYYVCLCKRCNRYYKGAKLSSNCYRCAVEEVKGV